ncbi:MAG: XTP/dITP diphosphatase [Syntrophomonadaceae bacterium]|jgi:XTP/dITP diphosphohydrolase
MVRELLIATRNRNKQRELQKLLEPLGIRVLTVEDISFDREIEEDGATFEENALKKARETARETGYHCLADDSGLVVDALNGQPGILSARFAGEDADDQKNNEKLLALLHNVEEEKRKASFVCAISICSPAEELARITERCPGKIAWMPRGPGGFGYDPLFIPEGFDKTFAEIPAEIKNRISHRGKALKKAIPVLQKIFASD